MKNLNRTNSGLQNRMPIKVLQFGEGNFLRAFIDFAFQVLNNETNLNAGIAVVQPIAKGLVDLLNQQDGLYHLFLNGLDQGKEVQKKMLISNIQVAVNPYEQYNQYLNLANEPNLQFIISNTTEAGIAYVAEDKFDDKPPNSFPAKLTCFLYSRFKYFEGNPEKGLTIIPCELINYNADTLYKIILKYIDQWGLENDFKEWVSKYNTFHNTLVDRIVPGYPKDQVSFYQEQLEYTDQLMVTAESFFLWVIEGDETLKQKLPFHKTNLNVKIVNDMQPYRTRKVRILNGAHTALVPISLLYGHETVREAVEDDFTGEFISEAVFNEIIDTLEMSRQELNDFASDVFERFKNPFIQHHLASIALNSVSKFKVRVLPSLTTYVSKNKTLPPHLTFAFACLIRFYKGEWQKKELPVNDDQSIMDTMTEIWDTADYAKISHEVLSRIDFWDQDLSKINGLTEIMAMALEKIDNFGIKNGFEQFLAVYETVNKIIDEKNSH